MITSEKLVGGGYPEVDRVQWRKIDAQLYCSLKEEFLTVMPLTINVGDQRTQIDKFFMVLTLIDLRLDLETIRDQILASSSIPSLDDVFARLLRISSTHTLPSDNTSDSSVLVSQTNSRGRRNGNRVASASQFLHVQGISLTDSEYDDYLHYRGTKLASIASVAQTGNASACFTHTSSLGPWILDSSAFDHISGNKDLFSSITTTSALPTITLANGSQTVAKGFGFAHPLPSLPLHYVLYALKTGVEEDDWHRTRLATLVYPSSRKWFLIFHLCRRLRTSKGYRCYSSETHRYFLSADVTFFEDPPFFSIYESLPVSEVLPLSIISHLMQCLLVQFKFIIAVIVSLFSFLAEVPTDSLPIPSDSLAPTLPPSANLPIALRKGWRQAMVDEMATLHSNDTWDLVVLPSGKSTVGCCWVYTVKIGPDGQIASVRLLLSMDAMRSWPLYQLDIKMLFFMGILLRKFIWSNHLVCCLGGVRFSVQEFGMFHSTADHSVFYHHNSSGQCIYLTKDLGKLKYFLGIEIAQSSSGVVLSQRKYALYILEETGMLDCKPVDTPMDPNVKLIPRQGEPLGDPGRYRRLVAIGML
ncbi:hypothetical protein CK203_030453 [Vitis vinifera]|uniref:Uncharacterized protein n=1 Tax=Vitis vinifera TaxID=29760 RepID=A0A438JDK3_VITVI|nr:hypothetical protein CK203_030453 [Vitis vinifera]